MITTRQFIYISLAIGLTTSLAALYIGYLIAQKQINATVASNPILKLFS